jgi:hypothetical protein
MKKIFFSFAFLLSVSAFSQVKIGLRLAPNFSSTSVNSSGVYAGFKPGSTGFRLMFGPNFDFFFQENYAFSTGLWYNVKASNIKAPTGEEAKFNVQYLTIPATIKLYTNEITTDVRIYFQVGGTIDIKLSEKSKNDVGKLFSDGKKIYRPINVGPYLGVGAELVLSTSNTVFAGINYSRGVIANFNDNVGDNSSIKTQTGQLALEIGLKF